MAYVIVDTCTKDEHCIEACPVNCIHPTKDEADFETVAQLS
jgi:NAD-dependent dihydropyrimidine dehydrogenase PreA subunit